MHVTHLTSSFPRYLGDFHGSFLKSQLEEICKYNIRISVVFPRGYQYIYEPNLILNLYPFRYFPQKLETLPNEPLYTISRSKVIQLPFYLGGGFFKTIKIHADVVHAQWAIPMGYIASISKNINKIPIVLTLHGYEVDFAKRFPPILYALKKACNSAQRIICVANHMKKDLVPLGIDEKKMEVIPLGINTKLYNRYRDSKYHIKADNSKLRIGTLSSLVALKRIQDVINSIKILKNYDYELLIGGDGPMRSSLEKQVRAYNLKNVEFLGQIPTNQVPSFLSSLDIFVLSSYKEGLSISLQEAMSCGCVPIVSDSLLAHELIIEGKTGYFYKYSNVHDLAQKIGIASKNLGIGTQARKHIEKNFEITKNTRKVVETYISVL
ncbi:MAG: glycosyltransferase family 4 protein [Candidatus Lokiarchaeota archaeon]|nr:glycosyltransferase family 4 protein [Candidatus Lokiarchaeota archaeon]